MLLILECKPDEKLAMALGIARKQIRHQNDKGQVCNFLKKSTGNIGLIDEDPNSAQPKYLANCTIISSQWNIKELSDRSGKHHINCFAKIGGVDMPGLPLFTN